MITTDEAGVWYVLAPGWKFGIGPAEAPRAERLKAIDYHLKRIPPGPNWSEHIDALLDARSALTRAPR